MVAKLILKQLQLIKNFKLYMNSYSEKFEKMRVAGKLAAQTLDMLTENIKEGISTDFIDKLGYEFIRDNGGYSAPLYYRGFKKSLCTSLNHVICHGVPTSGAPGFSVDNVFCLPGVPSILKSMLGGLKNKIVGGEPILSHTISLRTVESEIANSLTKVQKENKDVEIGSYPFFHAGKLGVSIVLRSENKSKIDSCNSQILDFVNKKKIEVVDR